MSIDNQRVTIKDIAEELGLSTATVSNVIHGKTKKISDTTVAKVQEKLEESGYIPNMAAVLLARNTSRIVCVLLSDDVKYEGHMLEDPFVAGMLNGLSKELRKADYFMMIREEHDINQIVTYASMWNMAGLILIGYCEQDYDTLRAKMHIPFVVIEACTTNVHKFSDIGLDNEKGGEAVAKHLYNNGHRHVMFVADNKDGCDLDRFHGFYRGLKVNGIHMTEPDYRVISNIKQDRPADYHKIYEEIKAGLYTAAFCASDIYAIELMQYLQSCGLSIPDDFSIVGFDDIPYAQMVNPKLTTVNQNLEDRAYKAVECLSALIEEREAARIELLPLKLIERETVRKID